MCLFAICISSSVKCLFMSLAHLVIVLFVFFTIDFENSLYILDISSLLDTYLQVSHPYSLYLYPLARVFAMQKLLILRNSNSFQFSSNEWCFLCVGSKNSLPSPSLQKLSVLGFYSDLLTWIYPLLWCTVLIVLPIQKTLLSEWFFLLYFSLSRWFIFLQVSKVKYKGTLVKYFKH